MNHESTTVSPPASSRTAWITGGANGIGKVIAERVGHAQGMRVVLLDRDEAGLDRAADELAAQGLDVATQLVDLQDREALPKTIAGLSRRLPADVLVNNAGVAIAAPATTYKLEDWDKSLAINLTAPLILTQQCLPHMQQQRWGRIINIASVSGLRAGIGRVGYGTSKAALIAMTQQFAVEVANIGVTVNAVAPSMVRSEMLERLNDPRQIAGMLARIPAGRYSEPHESADAVVFLASDQAGYVTGQTLTVDGGFTIAGWLNTADA